MESLPPLVSVIIPAYNAGKFITETIKSVINQTWKNLEIIIVNDGSIDDTLIVVNKFLGDDRIKLIDQRNQGSSHSRNTGLYFAKGDYIQYLDADDILSQNKIECQIEILKNKSSFEIAICRTKIFHQTIADSNKEIDSPFLYNTNNTFGFLLNLYGLNGKNGMIQPNSFLISRELANIIGPWNTSISLDDDGEYFCRVMLKAQFIHFSDGLNYYRKQLFSNTSLSNQHTFFYAKSELSSLILKTNNLLAVENSYRVKTTMAKHFSSLIYSNYNLYPDLSKKAEEYIINMGIKKIPITGGKSFKVLASIIGFKPALNLKKYLSSGKEIIKI